jgi:transcriptional regulator with XRE-family HTH domain
LTYCVRGIRSVATFGERLKHFREAAGLSQPGLADLSGVPVGTIRDYEQERREPLLSTAEKLALALKQPLESFQSSPPPAADEPAAKKRKKK